MVKIIYSTQDPAGTNIAEELRARGIDVIGVEGSLLHTPPEKLGIEEPVICISKHKSDMQIVSLTAHVPGNWSTNEYGGETRTLTVAPANLLKNTLRAMYEITRARNLTTTWPVTMEVTHHGPTSLVPLIFVEIGSSEKEWKRKDAAEIVSEGIIAALDAREVWKIAFGIGGGHYAPAFTRVMLESDYACGHVCPKYKLDVLDEEMFAQALDRTLERVETVLLDWKGMGAEHRERVSAWAHARALSIKKTKDVLHE